MPSSTSSSDEHAVAVREEPIPGFDRMTIRGESVFSARKRAHQHQQSRLRQVEVGEQRLDHFYARAGREKDVRSTAMGLEPSYAGAVLQYAYRGGASGHHAPAISERIVDLQGGFFRQRISFRVEANLRNLVH